MLRELLLASASLSESVYYLGIYQTFNKNQTLFVTKKNGFTKILIVLREVLLAFASLSESVYCLGISQTFMIKTKPRL